MSDKWTHLERVIYGAAYAIYVDAYWQEIESDEYDEFWDTHGVHYPAGSELTSNTRYCSQPDELLKIGKAWLAKIEKELGVSLCKLSRQLLTWDNPELKLFTDLDMVEVYRYRIKTEDMLFALFMSGVGHGVSLQDDYCKQLELTRKKLNLPLDIHGFNLDDWTVRDLAYIDAEWDMATGWLDLFSQNNPDLELCDPAYWDYLLTASVIQTLVYEARHMPLKTFIKSEDIARLERCDEILRTNVNADRLHMEMVADEAT